MAVRSARKTIPIDPDSEFARLLKRAAEEPALLDIDGMRFRVESEELDPFANYDPERARAALERAAGSWKGVNAEALIAELRAQRDQDSTGRPAL
jgi:hypothetical protein